MFCNVNGKKNNLKQKRKNKFLANKKFAEKIL